MISSQAEKKAHGSCVICVIKVNGNNTITTNFEQTNKHRKTLYTLHKDVLLIFYYKMLIVDKAPLDHPNTECTNILQMCLFQCKNNIRNSYRKGLFL